MNRNALWVIGGAVAAVAAGFWVRHLLEDDEVRAKLGLPPMNDAEVDVASSDSFPASDPPAFSQTSSSPA